MDEFLSAQRHESYPNESCDNKDEAKCLEKKR